MILEMKLNKWTTFYYSISGGRRWWQKWRAPHLLGMRAKVSKTHSSARLFRDCPFITVPGCFYIRTFLYHFWRLWHFKMAIGFLHGCSFWSSTRLGLVLNVAHSIIHSIFVFHVHGNHFIILCELLLLHLRHVWPLQCAYEFGWKSRWAHANRGGTTENQKNSSRN